MRQNFIVDDGSVVEYEDVFYCYCGDLDRMSILKLVGVLCVHRDSPPRAISSETRLLSTRPRQRDQTQQTFETIASRRPSSSTVELQGVKILPSGLRTDGPSAHLLELRETPAVVLSWVVTWELGARNIGDAFCMHADMASRVEDGGWEMGRGRGRHFRARAARALQISRAEKLTRALVCYSGLLAVDPAFQVLGRKKVLESRSG